MQKVLLVAAIVAGLGATACSRGANDGSSSAPASSTTTDGTTTPPADGMAPGATTPPGTMTSPDGSTTTTPPAGGGGPTAALDPANAQTFVTRVAMSDMLEVQASRAALTKTQNADVRKFAEMMIADHSKTTQQLTKLSQSASLTIPASADQATQAKITNLQNADADGFDDKYLDTIIDGHEDAVADFERYSKDGQDAELKSWATKTLPTLRTHLQQAQAIRKTVNRS